MSRWWACPLSWSHDDQGEPVTPKVKVKVTAIPCTPDSGTCHTLTLTPDSVLSALPARRDSVLSGLCDRGSDVDELVKGH